MKHPRVTTCHNSCKPHPSSFIHMMQQEGAATTETWKLYSKSPFATTGTTKMNSFTPSVMLTLSAFLGGLKCKLITVLKMHDFCYRWELVPCVGSFWFCQRSTTENKILLESSCLLISKKTSLNCRGIKSHCNDSSAFSFTLSVFCALACN